MAAQKGFEYEVNASNLLKEFGLVPKNFKPAGAGHDQPDLVLLYKGKTAGCELKITSASAGSLVVKYNDGEWGFGEIDKKDEEKLFIAELAKKMKIMEKLNKTWTTIPYKREKDALWEATAGQLKPKERYERDRKAFPEINGDIPAREIEDYYNRKNTYYVNVGTHGFYKMGSGNPYRLDLPSFSSAVKAKYRVRVQYKGSGNYQFTFEMAFNMTKKSPYNIAPLKKGSVKIHMPDLNLSVFKDL